MNKVLVVFLGNFDSKRHTVVQIVDDEFLDFFCVNGVFLESANIRFLGDDDRERVVDLLPMVSLFSLLNITV